MRPGFVGAVGVAALVWVTAAWPVATARSHCSRAETSSVVRRFVAAFDAGDRRTLNLVWASRVWFKWYSVGSAPGLRAGTAAFDRSTLMPYFAARHAAHERLVLTRLVLHGVSSGGYRNLEFRLLRSADDLPAGPVVYQGKGALTCSTGRLFVWAMSPA